MLSLLLCQGAISSCGNKVIGENTVDVRLLKENIVPDGGMGNNVGLAIVL